MTLWFADLMLTAQCNLHCPFCYGPDPASKRDLSDAQLFEVIDLLQASGCLGMVFAGGEPLSRPGAASFVAYARKKGLTTAVQTNATYPKILQQVLPDLDCLCLALDGVSAGAQFTMRTTAAHLETFRRACDLARDFRTNGGELKVGTVVSQANLSELDAIADEVAKVMPDKWKWYEVRKRGAAYGNFAGLHVRPESIHESAARIRTRYPRLPLHVSLDQMTNQAHLIIDSDGELLLTFDDAYVSFGHLFDESGAVNRTRWRMACGSLNEPAHLQNIQQSFPSRFNRWAERR